MSVRLVLGSASPARLATLRSAGVEPQVLVSGVDESQVTEPDPATLAARLAELKAEAVIAHLAAQAEHSVDTVVHFADVSDAEIEAYVASGEPLHVAGAFTIDGLGGAFVRGIEGDPHCVVGVSLPALREMVLELGRGWTDLWQHGR